MHIKFLDHGKGSAAHASAYVLDELDHLGNVRAGVEVLRGDATTFNAVCEANPHLWKYTSGVIGVVSGNGKYSTLRIFTPTSFNDIQHGIFA